jgi:ATP-dependent Clp protease ATP-binding subunit ClpX
VRLRLATSETLRCSFCRKSQDVVAKLISNPNDYPRAYICDECVAVCASIIKDDLDTVEAPSSRILEEPDPLPTHPLASPFLAAVERWLQRESLGDDAAEEFVEMRNLAIRLIRGAG